jgi:hypothetical protein
MLLSDDEGGFSVEVVDAGPADSVGTPMDMARIALDSADAGTDTAGRAGQGARPARDAMPPGFGLAVIAGLVEHVEISGATPTGTRVRMWWPAGEQAGESLAAMEADA